jgi:hypothetical protein
LSAGDADLTGAVVQGVVEQAGQDSGEVFPACENQQSGVEV